MTTIKWGPKNRHIQIPDGYEIVKEGNVELNDMFLNLSTYRFNMVDEDDLRDSVESFDVLIRKI
jgi:hypothetical protein